MGKLAALLRHRGQHFFGRQLRSGRPWLSRLSSPGRGPLDVPPGNASMTPRPKNNGVFEGKRVTAVTATEGVA
jgi:hypothetical protein